MCLGNIAIRLGDPTASVPILFLHDLSTFGDARTSHVLLVLLLLIAAALALEQRRPQSLAMANFINLHHLLR